MYCETCHERLKSGTSKCPNCGHVVKGNADLGSGSVRDLSNSTSYSLPPAPKVSKGDAKEPPSRVAESQDRARAAARRTRANTRAGSAPLRSSGSKAVELGFELDTDGIRDLLIANPGLIEEGLRLYTEGDGARPDGRYETSVGTIDLLARDSAAGWVIILIAESEPGKELVANLLELMGWVTTHLCDDDEEVRAVVLVDSAPQDLGYAAAAIADCLEFKRYRLGLTLEDIEV